MTGYAQSVLPVRADIEEAHLRFWNRLSRPGSWWTAAERVAIAGASRHSEICSRCKELSDALSPGGLGIDHENTPNDSVLSPAVVAVVHRIRQDASRLTRSVVNQITAEVMSEGAYVELVGVVASTIAVDAFADALGEARWSLPEPLPGEPDRYTPQGLSTDLAWLPVVDPSLARGREVEIYARQSAANIHRALTLVPAEKHGFFDLDDVMYLPDAQLRDFENEYRAIDHAQIELLAARVSALNRCHY